MTNKVIVFGSINLDLVTQVAAHPKPGETIQGSDYQMLPGGKGANQALAAARALEDPSKALLLGCVGKDDFADIALRNLVSEGVDLSNVSRTDTGTAIAMIAVANSGENSIIVCPGANAETKAEAVAITGLSKTDVLLTQQEIPAAEVWASHALAKSKEVIVIHNCAPAADIPPYALENIDILISNETEAAVVARHLEIAGETPQRMCKAIASRFGKTVILTLGENGAFFFADDGETHHPTKKVDVVDTTGAGDVFCGTFAAMLAQKHTVNIAIERAIEEASKACTRFGAQ